MVHGVHSADEPGCRGRLARGGGAVSLTEIFCGHGNMGLYKGLNFGNEKWYYMV